MGQETTPRKQINFRVIHLRSWESRALTNLGIKVIWQLRIPLAGRSPKLGRPYIHTYMQAGLHAGPRCMPMYICILPYLTTWIQPGHISYICTRCRDDLLVWYCEYACNGSPRNKKRTRETGSMAAGLFIYQSTRTSGSGSTSQTRPHNTEVIPFRNSRSSIMISKKVSTTTNRRE